MLRFLLTAAVGASLLFPPLAPRASAITQVERISSVKVGAPCNSLGAPRRNAQRWFECRGVWKPVRSNAACKTDGQEVGPYTCLRKSGALKWNLNVARAWADCDPEDPRIAEANITLPTSSQEAKIAAACMALEWLRRPAPPESLVTEVRGPTVHPLRNATDRDGLLAMERLIGHRFRPRGAPILLRVIGNDVRWACQYGKANIDPRIPRPTPWTNEWLGCATEQWVCGGSYIELTDGTRFIFGACPKEIIDGSLPPPEASAWNGLRSGHELIQILFYQITDGDWGRPKGTWGGLEARTAGVQFFERNAAWLAGTPRNWRYDESGSGQYSDARQAWRAWRQKPGNEEGNFNYLKFLQELTYKSEDPEVSLSDAAAYFAGEFLVAHWGIGPLFEWLSGSKRFADVYDITQARAMRLMSAYIESQLSLNDAE